MEPLDIDEVGKLTVGEKEINFKFGQLFNKRHLVLSNIAVDNLSGADRC